MLTEFQIKKIIVEVEKNLSEYLNEEMGALNTHKAAHMNYEIGLSIASLLAARVIAFNHIMTGEGTKRIKQRFDEAFEENLKISIQKMLKELWKKENVKTAT